LSSYVISHHLAAESQLGAKDQFYCTVNYINLNSNCEAQRISKNLKVFVDDRTGSQKLMHG
jgi:hypothetical protein